MRYSSLFALTLAGVLLVALKSNALIQYWQQSRHILLDVAPPPSVGELVTEHLFSADLTAPFTEAAQWLLALGQAPWPSNLDQDELVASEDDDIAPIIDAEPPKVNTAAAASETKQPAVIADKPSNAEQSNFEQSNVDQSNAEPSDTVKGVETANNSQNVDADKASDATARLIAQTNGASTVAGTNPTTNPSNATDGVPATPEAPTNATLNSLDAMGNIELEPQDRVLLIGDSLMQGLAPHLVARFKKKDQIQTVDMSRHSTGLTYPAFYNWPNAVKKAFSEQSYDVMIVFMGANDPWDMTVKGKYIRFASTRWNEIYRERVRTILQIASDHNTRVIWLGTPPMGRDDIKGKIPQLNALYKAEIDKFSATARFIDTAPVLTTDGVSYSRFIELPERGSVMLRTDDGIHFTTQGHRLLSKLTLAQFRLPQPKKSP